MGDRYALMGDDGFIHAYYNNTPVQRQLAVTHALITGHRVLDTWQGEFVL